MKHPWLLWRVMFITKNKGFTLLEILIALFIFTILSMMLVKSLHSVIDLSSRTDQHATRLRQMQMALLILSRDIEQIVDRPIFIASGAKEASLVGTSREFTFTHMGFANPMGMSVQSNLQRTRFFWDNNSLWQMSWEALDQAPSSKSHTRRLLEGVTTLRFQYLDQLGRFHDDWPLLDQTNQILPQAIRISFTLASWGKMSQFYVIPTKQNKNG